MVQHELRPNKQQPQPTPVPNGHAGTAAAQGLRGSNPPQISVAAWGTPEAQHHHLAWHQVELGPAVQSNPLGTYFWHVQYCPCGSPGPWRIAAAPRLENAESYAADQVRDRPCKRPAAWWAPPPPPPWSTQLYTGPASQPASCRVGAGVLGLTWSGTASPLGACSQEDRPTRPYPLNIPSGLREANIFRT